MGLVGNDIAPIFQVFSDYDLFNARSDFCFVRLMNGLWVEPNFSSVWNNIHVPKAPYLNLSPFANITEQVSKFYMKVMEYAPDFSLIPVFDTENLLLTAGMISTAWGVGYAKFGNYPMPYSSQNFWPKAYPDYPSVPRWVANYPNSLVGLRYDDLIETKIELARLNGFPNMPDDWKPFREPGDFWQCSKTGYGPDWGLKWPDSKAIDVDYFDGTLADMQAVVDKWHGIVIPPEPGDEIVPLKEVRVIATAGLNIRSLPDADSKDIGTLVYNSTVPVVEEEGDWYRIDGYIYKPLTTDN